MTKASVILVGVGAFVIALMILFPPYFVIDSQSNGRVHGSIGYHPIWKPPTSEYGYARLHSKDPSADPVSKISKERLDSYEIGINKVGLAMQSILVVVLVSVGMVIIKKRQRWSNKRMQLSGG
jgi:hypothetical protein